MKDPSYLPMISGVPFETPEERERLMDAARNAPDPIDPPAAVIRHVPPVVLGGTGPPSDWEARVRQAVRDGALVVDHTGDLRVMRAVADESALLHEAEARRARVTVAVIDAAGKAGTA